MPLLIIYTKSFENTSFFQKKYFIFLNMCYIIYSDKYMKDRFGKISLWKFLFSIMIIIFHVGNVLDYNKFKFNFGSGSIAVDFFFVNFINYCYSIFYIVFKI